MSGAAENEWIAWGGGECPLPEDARVHVRLRSGIDSEQLRARPIPAGNFDWSAGSVDPDGSDIIAYRVIP